MSRRPFIYRPGGWLDGCAGGVMHALAEELDRRRRWLTEVSKLVASALFKATPHSDSPAYFRCTEQMELQTMLAGKKVADLETELPAVKALAAAGQGMEAFAAAARADIEIQAAMHNLTAPQG